MRVHKLTAGDGYTYLTRQVRVHDATDRGHAGLADYYAENAATSGTFINSTSIVDSPRPSDRTCEPYREEQPAMDEIGR